MAAVQEAFEDRFAEAMTVQEHQRLRMIFYYENHLYPMNH